MYDSNTPTLRLEAVNGDLRLRRWSGQPETAARVRLLADDQEPQEYDLPADLPTIDGDAVLLVAGPGALAIGTIRGDCTGDHLACDLRVGLCQGDVILEALTGHVRLDAVQGDLGVIELDGDLTVGEMVGGDLTADHVRGAIQIGQLNGDANIRAAASLDVTRGIAGDLRVQDVTVIAIAGPIKGDATLSHVATGTVQAVRGDLTALDIGEDLRVGPVSGDVRLRDVRAPVTLGDVAGDLAAQEIAGLHALCRATAYLETSLKAGADYQVTAREIILRVRSPISAQFVAQSHGGEIRTHLPLNLDRRRQSLVGVIGKGEATVTLTANGGDILVDVAGRAGADDDPASGATASGKRGFRIHIGAGLHGDSIDLNGPWDTILSDLATGWWPFNQGASSMSNPQQQADIEQRLRELSERSGRAARKAAEKFREYADRAATRARETDWDAVSREVRTAIERTVTELESTFREIVAEFQAPPTPGSTTSKATSGATAQRIIVDNDDPTTPTPPTPPTPPTGDADARRRAILEQVRNGELTLDDAEKQLRNL